jgi:hypothetical protein
MSSYKYRDYLVIGATFNDLAPAQQLPGLNDASGATTKVKASHNVTFAGDLCISPVEISLGCLNLAA